MFNKTHHPLLVFECEWQQQVMAQFGHKISNCNGRNFRPHSNKGGPFIYINIICSYWHSSISPLFNFMSSLTWTNRFEFISLLYLLYTIIAFDNWRNYIPIVFWSYQRLGRLILNMSFKHWIHGWWASMTCGGHSPLIVHNAHTDINTLRSLSYYPIIFLNVIHCPSLCFTTIDVWVLICHCMYSW